jgi:acetylornithine deacetylase/succinyl-diaminopimelate desuccinylase-like protein
MTPSRSEAIARAARAFDEGRLFSDLARRVAYRTESQNAQSWPELTRYLTDELAPRLAQLGFATQVIANPVPSAGPFLLASRIEDDSLPTVLGYGHGDVIRGLEGQWRAGLDPWVLHADGERWYGRGTADNKGQHSVNLLALEQVIAERGRLGFNCKYLIETGEEVGSPGLAQLCREHPDKLAADLFIASDGPRLSPQRPTLFMGARGALNFDLTVKLRDGAHHSGNWGGLLANPAVVLAHALASLIDAHGRVQVRAIVPSAIPPSVRAALQDCPVESPPQGPAIDADWGEPDLSAAEKVYAWNTFEVLACKSGNPEHPVNAIPAWASAHCQIRFTADVDPDTFLPAIRAHLAANGFDNVDVTAADKGFFRATRLDPDHPAALWAAESIAHTTGTRPAVLPNIGGSLPNDCFAETLGLPTLWVPHSYAGCSQHAPDEHALAPLLREGLQIMTGLYWDLGSAPPPLPRRT